ncbi:ABC transporter ATP-binding protein [Jannaschia sp. LMIT008]|uniref:ABC transporter ATP-binding protein n=1 Tax=Jannaschia maritima TaxID=3032585 RepID=UPI002810CB12|nr:ABC transporter ATP-binding protein [Jannaschia sp. LMIT008]
MIRLDELTKIFDTPSGQVVASDRVDMEVPEGEICVLLGPSGCGKTTTMKMVNRLIEPTSGKIFIGDTDVTKQNPIELRRTIGYVIQQIGLFPNKTIEDNICAVPDLLGWDRKKSRARAAELLEMVALDPGTFLKRYPKELSGGQQQRVGVIRALAADPPVMLMDEPFGAIDPINREVIQDEFLRMQGDFKKTIMFVSHDIDEAVKMANRIAIFDAGKLIQYDAPDDLLAHPKNSFIADFVGGDRTLKRLRLITVGDAMMSDPPTVRAEDTLADAAAKMEEHGHISIVMVGPKGRARGIVYLSDARGAKGRVGENHKKLPASINAREDLRTAVSMMFTHDETSLAVVDDDGFYKGYVTQRGITHLLGATYRDA